LKAYVITIAGDSASEAGAQRLRESSAAVGNEFEVETFEAVTPDELHEAMAHCSVLWTYPWDEEKSIAWRVGREEKARLTLHPYTTRDRDARMSCFMSHHTMWRLCFHTVEPHLILEDDAIFTQKFDPTAALESDFAIVGINDPRGATRRSAHFHFMVQTQQGEVAETPWIDKPDVPQGLAGASAYLVKPEGARRAIELTRECGAWPNDALLCKQLMPGMLGVCKTYATKVTGSKSTLA
jgi:GR25 family glycosyltransferase involved in LPS biosynthesis